MESIETGVTAFSPESTYRFVITSQSQKVKLTLEDLKSKKQWSSGYLDDKEYLTGTNKIPNASLSDYVKVFKDTLEYLMAKIDETKESKLQKLEPGKIRRKLIPVENDAMQLELSVKIKIFQNAWTAKYVFTLAPVALNRFDILEAKLRDVDSELEEAKEDLEEEKQESAALGEELKQVKSKLAAVETTLASVQKKDSPVYLNASAKNTEKLNDKGQILLTSIQGVGFLASKDNSAVRFAVAGWYTINATVFLTPQATRTGVELHLNDKYFQSQWAAHNAQQHASVVISTTHYFKRDDEIMLIVTGPPLQVGADLRAFKLGG